MNKFEHVSSLDHQMSLAGGKAGAVWGEGGRPGPCTDRGPVQIGDLYSEV